VGRRGGDGGEGVGGTRGECKVRLLCADVLHSFSPPPPSTVLFVRFTFVPRSFRF
jgi:hypothetical protein